MGNRHLLGFFNSTKASEIITKIIARDFPDSVENHLVFLDNYGWYNAISVDADEFNTWIALPREEDDGKDQTVDIPPFSYD
jgi:hypothetical protein